MVRILLAAALLCLLLLTLAPGCSLRSCLLARQQGEALLRENERLLQETAQIEKEIRLLEQDKNYLEKVARERYDMLRKDEEVYYVESEAEKMKD